MAVQAIQEVDLSSSPRLASNRAGWVSVLIYERVQGMLKESQVLVTPEAAQLWLDTKNINNRPVVRSNVLSLIDEILAGRWRSDHPHGIVFDTNGVLIDGQHRLLAIVESKTPVWCKVTTGADPSLKDFIDTGKTRTLADRTSLVSDAWLNRNVTQVCRYMSAGTTANSTLTSLRSAFYACPESVVWAAQWLGKSKQRGITRAPVAAALAKLHAVNSEVAEKCAASLLSPDGEVQPMRVLRDWLLRSASHGGAAVCADVHLRSITAMNYALSGKTVKQLKASPRPVVSAVEPEPVQV